MFMLKIEEEKEEQRQKDIEANRIEAGTADLFKRLEDSEKKLQSRGIQAMVVMALCILLSVWLIAKRFVRRTTLDLRTYSGSNFHVNIGDMDGALEAYKGGSIVLLEGTCDYGENFVVPISIQSSAMYWIKPSGSSRRIVRADGSVLISMECPSLNSGTCKLTQNTICNNT